jgi:hypothetical protein
MMKVDSHRQAEINVLLDTLSVRGCMCMECVGVVLSGNREKEKCYVFLHKVVFVCVCLCVSGCECRVSSRYL